MELAYAEMGTERFTEKGSYRTGGFAMTVEKVADVPGAFWASVNVESNFDVERSPGSVYWGHGAKEILNTWTTPTFAVLFSEPDR